MAESFDAFKDAQNHSYRDQPHEYDGHFLGEKVNDKLGVPRNDGLTLDEAIARVPDR